MTSAAQAAHPAEASDTPVLAPAPPYGAATAPHTRRTRHPTAGGSIACASGANPSAASSGLRSGEPRTGMLLSHHISSPMSLPPQTGGSAPGLHPPPAH